MIEATCSACGTLNRIAEADVPAGAKFVTCTSCKSRVGLPTPKAAGIALPKLPPVLPRGPLAGALGPAGSGGGKNDIIDLADLPAPRRQSSLGGEGSKAAPKSGLASALDELPAPKPRPGAAKAVDLEDMPAPKPRAPAPIDLDDMMGGPAADVSDLPAPRGARQVTRAPTPPPSPTDIISDLPTPRGRATTPSTAPRTVPASNALVIDLPAPRPGGARALTDLPVPRAPTPPPVRNAPSGIPANLPTPKSPGGPGSVDLPAPKGFFDDLPQPAKGGGRGEQAEVPAPKGFFDDLPQPARGTKGGPQAPQNDIAPKGFFDDLPQKAQNRTGLPTPAQAQPPAPKGFFDDLPQPAKGGSDRNVQPTKGGSDRNGQPATAREQNVAPRGDFGSGAIDLGSDPIEPIDLAMDDQPLTLDGPAATSFDNLDLSAPSTPQSRVAAEQQEEAEKAGIKFSAKKPGAASAAGAGEKATLPSFSKQAGAGADMALELEEPRDKGQAPGTTKIGSRQKEVPSLTEAVLAKQRRRKRNIIGGFALGIALLGSGGFYMYRRHAAQQERADSISEALSAARKAMIAEDANHWQRAATSASKVLELDPKHAEAYGIAAEASIAGALADGKTAQARITKGRKLISDALAAGVTGPALERAQALATLTTTPDKAPAKLEALLAKSPKDGTLAIYVAWAHEANGNIAEAIKAYDRASQSPSVKVMALVGRARAKLVLNDIEGARADFTTILAVDGDNIPAQIGLAATLPVGQAQQQESEILAVLARKDIANGDPRAVVEAWVLAADLARKGGRLDAARERYRKALALSAKDLGGMTGLAEIELREKRVEIAEELITKVLTIAPNNANGQLVQCEISLRKGDIADAEKRIKLLAARTPPLAPLDGARLMIVKGKLHEYRKEDEEAVAAYVEGAKLAGDRDLTATFAAVSKLTEMAKVANDAKNIDKEAALRARAEELLLALAELAYKDPQLALTLANAYLQSGAPAKAEPWLRRVIDARPKDADALYQLGKVLRKQGKGIDAIDKLTQAREIEPLRAEIGLELARTYELTRRDPEAGKLYVKLLEDPDPSLELRGHAGKFFVRTGKLAEAGEQGQKILALDKLSAAGHYLNAEGLLANGHLEDARKEFTLSIELERDARHFDGLGRATESLSMQRNRDLTLQDAALRAYLEASKLDTTLFSPFLGMGRLYVARKEMNKAVISLLAANKLNPGDPDVAYLLGIAYQVLGTKETKKTAVAWLRKSNELKQSAETSYQLGQLYQDNDINLVPPAIEAYKIATNLAEIEIKKTGTVPTWYPEALYQLGDLANSLGEEVTACKAWKKYLGTAGNKNPVRVQTANRALATGLQGVCQ